MAGKSKTLTLQRSTWEHGYIGFQERRDDLTSPHMTLSMLEPVWVALGKPERVRVTVTPKNA